MAIVYIVCACVVLLAIGTLWIRVRTQRMAASRPGETFETFRGSFESEEIPPEVQRAVYATFQAWCSGAVVAFPVRADDDICRVYGMVDEDLDDAVTETLAACGRQLPPQEQLRQMQPVRTVRDLARFVSRCPEPPG
jgi:hypothetical protein